MAFVFEGIIGASISLAFVYLVLLIYVSYQLYLVHNDDINNLIASSSEQSRHNGIQSPSIAQAISHHHSTGYNALSNSHRSTLNTKKVFIMTCLLTCLLRLMSFTSMAIFDLSAIHYSTNTAESGVANFDDNVTGTEEFFEKSFLVLFDFPDFCIISAYSLLMVCWAESYLQSRRHWLSSASFRRVWMFSYLVFNILLYGCQVGLYTLLFIPTVDKNILSVFIYLTLTAYNLVLPMLWMVVYLYLAIMFSGFPYASPTAQHRLSKLGTVVTIWTITRIGWGFITLTTVLQGWLNILSTTNLGHTLILIGIFMAAEVLPILFSLQPSSLSSLSDKRSSVVTPSAPYSSMNETSGHLTYYIEPSPSPLPLPDPSSQSRYNQNRYPSSLTGRGVDNLPGNDYLISLLNAQDSASIDDPSHYDHQTSRSNEMPIESRQSRGRSFEGRHHSNSLGQQSSDDSFKSAHGFPSDFLENTRISLNDGIAEEGQRRSLGFWGRWLR